MIQNRKRPTGTLLLAGLAAFAYYKYSKMSEEQKRNLVGGLKEKGQRWYDQYVPQNIKDMIDKKGGSNTASNGNAQNFNGTTNNYTGGTANNMDNSRFGEGSDYTS